MAALLAGCGGGGSNHTASHSSPTVSTTSTVTTTPSAAATTSPSAAPSPVTGAYGVLYSSQAASSYSVSLVGIDGKVVATVSAKTPPNPTCANAAAAPVPAPVSTSNSLVYYMDADGIIWSLGPNGPIGRVTAVPGNSTSQRSMFAVSPDDQRIAVVVATYNASGASTRLYIENLDGTGHVDLFSESGAYSLWPIGWHGTNNLVLAKVQSCRQGAGIGGNGIIEYHVVDPATATRRFTLGGSCTGMSPPAPAGVICEAPPNATVLSWTNAVLRTLPIQGPVGAYLSPSGTNVAFVDNTGTTFTNGGSAMAGVFTCTWIDDTHVLAGGDSQNQARVGNLSNGQIVPVPAQGDCAGRLPGGL